ncbi:MAG: LUD domain-containing protein, partial [Lachnospiraceae bacterium]|nr:LUD domain-containing protein [Lachnospiraceae bacterium]
MNEVLERTAEAIRRNGFEVHVFDTAAQAAYFLDAEIDGKFVGLGDSMTLGAMGLY